MIQGTETKGREASCGHWLPPGARFHDDDGTILCNLCAAKRAVTTQQRQAILGLPARPRAQAAGG